MNKDSRRLLGGAFLIGASALVWGAGCRSDDNKALGNPRPNEGSANENFAEQNQGATPEAASDAASSAVLGSIAEARCAREVQCDNVGQGKKWATRDACVAEHRANAAPSLKGRECGSVNQSELTACIKEIQAEKCGASESDLEKFNACKAENLCKANLMK